MSNRERWILYPLVFLALAVSLRDKIMPARIQATMRAAQIETGELRANRCSVDVVRCQQLLVIGPDGEHWVVAAGAVPHTNEGRIQVAGADHQTQVVIAAAQGGGIVQTMAETSVPGQPGAKLTIMGHDGQGKGDLSLYDIHGNRYAIVTTRPIRQMQVPNAPPVTQHPLPGDENKPQLPPEVGPGQEDSPESESPEPVPQS